jgi:hypothetical protein
VGRLVRERRDADGRRVYRFLVDRPLKGPVGREIEIRAPLLTDTGGTPIAHDVAVGVLAELRGAAFTTTSCGIVDAGSLVSISQPERGTTIKVVIGVLILAAVLGYSLLRLRRRRQAEQAGPGSRRARPPGTEG